MDGPRSVQDPLGDPCSALRQDRQGRKAHGAGRRAGEAQTPPELTAPPCGPQLAVPEARPAVLPSRRRPAVPPSRPRPLQSPSPVLRPPGVPPWLRACSSAPCASVPRHARRPPPGECGASLGCGQPGSRRAVVGCGEPRPSRECRGGRGKGRRPGSSLRNLGLPSAARRPRGVTTRSPTPAAGPQKTRLGRMLARGPGPAPRPTRCHGNLLSKLLPRSGGGHPLGALPPSSCSLWPSWNQSWGLIKPDSELGTPGAEAQTGRRGCNNTNFDSSFQARAPSDKLAVALLANP